MTRKIGVAVLIMAVSLFSFSQTYTVSGQFFTTQITTKTQILTGTSTSKSGTVSTVTSKSTLFSGTSIVTTIVSTTYSSTSTYLTRSTIVTTITTAKTSTVLATITNLVPVPPNPFPSGRTVGFIGCSNSYQSIVGYQTVVNQTKASNHLWDAYNTGDGTLEQWANPNSVYWTKYQQQVAGYGQPKIVWIQICEHYYAPLTPAMVNETIANLRAISPSVIIYISPLNTYDPVGSCSATGQNGIQDATALANLAVAEGLALQGPILGPVSTSAGTVGSDGCHLSSAGEILVGNQLVTFFNGRGIY